MGEMVQTGPIQTRPRICDHCEATRSWLVDAAELEPYGKWFPGAKLLLPEKRGRMFPHEEIMACPCRCHDLYKGCHTGQWEDPRG